MAKLSCDALCGKGNKKWENVGGMLYSFSTSHTRRAQPPPIGGFQGGGNPPAWGLGQRPEIFFRPYIKSADLPMVLSMGFSRGYVHDVFLPMVFCRSSQGNYDYDLI